MCCPTTTNLPGYGDHDHLRAMDGRQGQHGCTSIVGEERHCSPSGTYVVRRRLRHRTVVELSGPALDRLADGDCRLHRAPIIPMVMITNEGNGGKEEEIEKRVVMIVNEGKKEEEDPCPASMPYHRPIDGRSDDVHVFEHVGDG